MLQMFINPSPKQYEGKILKSQAIPLAIWFELSLIYLKIKINIGNPPPIMQFHINNLTWAPP